MGKRGSVGKRQLNSLTGLRFLAALVVFGAHVHVLVKPSPLSERLLLQGRTGVSFFFVLSGFVLAWSWNPDRALWDFYRRRFARVYPAHAAISAVLAAVALVGGVSVGHALVTSTLLVQSWVPRMHVYYGLNGVAWSLSCEAFFYALFPFVMPLVLRLEPRGRRALFAALISLVLLAALIATGRTETGSIAYWAVYILPPVRMLEFLVGVLVAVEVRENRWPAISLARAGALAAAAYLLAGFVPDSFSYVSVTLLPYAILIGAAATADLGGLRSPFRSPSLVRLGTWSFAFYLVHQELVLRWNQAFSRLVGTDIGSLDWTAVTGISILMLASAVVAAGVLYTFIERPMEQRLRPRHPVVPRSVIPVA